MIFGLTMDSSDMHGLTKNNITNDTIEYSHTERSKLRVQMGLIESSFYLMHCLTQLSLTFC